MSERPITRNMASMLIDVWVANRAGLRFPRPTKYGHLVTFWALERRGLVFAGKKRPYQLRLTPLGMNVCAQLVGVQPENMFQRLTQILQRIREQAAREQETYIVSVQVTPNSSN